MARQRLHQNTDFPQSPRRQETCDRITITGDITITHHGVSEILDRAAPCGITINLNGISCNLRRIDSKKPVNPESPSLGVPGAPTSKMEALSRESMHRRRESGVNVRRSDPQKVEREVDRKRTESAEGPLDWTKIEWAGALNDECFASMYSLKEREEPTLTLDQHRDLKPLHDSGHGPHRQTEHRRESGSVDHVPSRSAFEAEMESDDSLSDLSTTQSGRYIDESSPETLGNELDFGKIWTPQNAQRWSPGTVHLETEKMEMIREMRRLSVCSGINLEC